MTDQTRVRERIFCDIREERLYQEDKWGSEFDAKNTADDWVTYIAHYATAAAPIGVISAPFDVENFKTKMLKVATLAVAAIEAAELNNGIAKRHFDT